MSIVMHGEYQLVQWPIQTPEGLWYQEESVRPLSAMNTQHGGGWLGPTFKGQIMNFFKPERILIQPERTALSYVRPSWDEEAAQPETLSTERHWWALPALAPQWSFLNESLGARPGAGVQMSPTPRLSWDAGGIYKGLLRGRIHTIYYFCPCSCFLEESRVYLYLLWEVKCWDTAYYLCLKRRA